MSIFAQLPKGARRLLISALLLPSALLILAAVQGQKSEDRLLLSYRWVSHTHDVEKQLQNVSLDATRMLATHRGAADGEALRAATQAIKELTHDNEVQQREVLLLEERVEAHLTGPQALSTVSLERVNEVSARMWSEEERLLKLRQQSLLAHIHERTFFIWGLVALNAGLLAGVFWLARRLTRLERLVHICAWTRTIEYQGEWITFEVYLERRFGIKTSHGIAPEQAERLMAELKQTEEAAMTGR